MRYFIVSIPDLCTLTYFDETSIVDRHRCLMAAKFGLSFDEDDCKLPALYWLPKLYKRPYKLRFIANSSACTTSELSILLTSCLTASIAQLVERPLSEREVVGSNPAAAPYQRCKKWY